MYLKFMLHNVVLMKKPAYNMQHFMLSHIKNHWDERLQKGRKKKKINSVSTTYNNKSINNSCNGWSFLTVRDFCLLIKTIYSIRQRYKTYFWKYTCNDAFWKKILKCPLVVQKFTFYFRPKQNFIQKGSLAEVAE